MNDERTITIRVAEEVLGERRFRDFEGLPLGTWGLFGCFWNPMTRRHSVTFLPNGFRVAYAETVQDAHAIVAAIEEGSDRHRWEAAAKFHPVDERRAFINAFGREEYREVGRLVDLASVPDPRVG